MTHHVDDRIPPRSQPFRRNIWLAYALVARKKNPSYKYPPNITKMLNDAENNPQVQTLMKEIENANDLDQ